jgi:UDP-GlcNAc:undecaprenyl-phosphate/decaprenyl-phosphate GlcNAc-1-phosphate transferase
VTLVEVVAAFGLALAGGVGARALARKRVEAPPTRLERTNYRGSIVPAVLGGPIVVAGLATAAAAGVWLTVRSSEEHRVSLSCVILLLVMGLAGSWDDTRGDEQPRGFGGHLGAFAGGGITGGIVKLGAGLVSGLAAALLISDGWGIVTTTLLIAASANLVNLFDRAPGRAAKVAALLFLPGLVWAGDFAVAAAGTVGALAGVVGLDLGERAMLGDAGANPLGALAGFGLALVLPPGWAWFVVGLLIALNLASEKWSFSRAIEKRPWLARLDHLGRK